MGQNYQLEQSTDRYLLEEGSGVYLLEVQDVSLALTGQQVDSGHGRIRADWHIESQSGQPTVAVAVALAGLASASATGTITAAGESPDRTEALSGLEAVSEHGAISSSLAVDSVGHAILSASGLVLGALDVAGTGVSLTPAHGALIPATTGILSGLNHTSASGTVAVASLRILDGLESIGSTGLVSVPGDGSAALVGQGLVATLGTLSALEGDNGSELFAMQRQRRFGRSTAPLAHSRIPRKVR